eukprot:15328180-Ditylum_brightwellii.AAC.2
MSLSTNEDRNNNMEAFTNAMNSSKGKDERMKSLMEDIDAAVLTADAEKKIAILHSFNMIGGTRAHSEKKMICLLGMGPEAVCVEVNIASISRTCNFRAPKSEDMKTCENADALETLAEPGNRVAINNKGSASFILAPFLRDVLMEADNKEPLELTPVAFAVAKEYDDTYEDGKAAAHTETFASWAWGVKKEKVTETKYFVHPDDGEMRAFTKEKHAGCIIAPLYQEEGRMESSIDTSSVLQQLSVSISKSNKEAELANKLRTKKLEKKEKKEEKKKDTFNKLHRSVKNMILMASTEDSDKAVEDPGELCLHFINSETTALAGQELNFMLKDMGHDKVGFAYDLTQSLHAGSFTYQDSSTLCNLSTFCFLSTDSRPRKDSCRMQDLSKATDKGTNVYGRLGKIVGIFTTGTKIFFKSESKIHRELKGLGKQVKSIQQIFKARLVTDEKIAAKCLFYVDSKVQRFLQQCRTTKDRCEVDATS